MRVLPALKPSSVVLAINVRTVVSAKGTRVSPYGSQRRSVVGCEIGAVHLVVRAKRGDLEKENIVE